MSIRYLINGTKNEIESAFFLYIYISNHPNNVHTELYELTIIEDASDNNTIDENIKNADIIDKQEEQSFLHCLNNIELYINKNNIKFSIARLYSVDRSSEIDNELQRFLITGTTA